MAVTKVRVAYGDGGLDIEVDAAAVTVVEPTFSAPAPDPSAVLRRALRTPVAGGTAAGSCPSWPDGGDRRL